MLETILWPVGLAAGTVACWFLGYGVWSLLQPHSSVNAQETLGQAAIYVVTGFVFAMLMNHLFGPF